jgi:hypothetical protein
LPDKVGVLEEQAPYMMTPREWVQETLLQLMALCPDSLSFASNEDE